MRLRFKTLGLWLLGLMGFSACDLIHPKVMYGQPYADYDFDLIITDENDVPIPGIQTKSVYGEAPVSSDSDGRITFHRDYEMDITLTDVDGAANGGEFQDKLLDKKELNVVQTKKGQDWYLGAFEITGTVKMKKKDAE